MFNKTSNYHHPLAETLEKRTLLAGDVTAAIHGSALVISGDRNDNSIVITKEQAEAGRLLVQGQNTTVNGASADAFFPADIRKVRINLRGGTDTLVIQDAQLAGNLEIDTGAQADSVLIQGLSIARDLRIRTSSGDDRLDIVNTTVTGRTNVSTGVGNDIVTSTGSTFHGRFIVDTKQGDDSISLDDSVFDDETIVKDGPGNDVVNAHTVRRSYDFREGKQGWHAGFADFATNQKHSLELQAGIRTLPSEVGEGSGFYIKGKNASDDLFMYLYRQLDRRDGIRPNQSYEVHYVIRFASNAPTGAVGVGGAPGESVWLKAGASASQPRQVVSNKFVYVNIDHGQQAEGGTAASLIGNIANGNTDIDGPYVSLTREHVHTAIVKSDAKGRLYLIVGTDSGFESTTALYYQRIEVRLAPVTQKSQEKAPEPSKPGNLDDNPV